MMKKVFASILLVFTITNSSVYSQDGDLGSGGILGEQRTINVIQTPVPFLNIVPDSRAGAMGDLGVATSPDNNSLHWNAAKYAFMEEELGFSTSYSPWLKNLAADIKLLYLTGYMKLDKQSAVAFGLRYFTLGSIQFTNDYGDAIRSVNPNELTADISYSRLFSDKFSSGITFRYIRSDLTLGSQVGGEDTQAGTAYAVDLSTYYRTPVTLGGRPGEWAWGINISNLGSKISYNGGDVKDFIPANLRIGTSVTMELDAYNKLTLSTDLNKLLVPSPPIYATDSLGNYIYNGDSRVILQGKDPDVSIGQGVIQSFYDAPGGFDEELKEIMVSVGAEYWYHNQFAIRGGYFGETAMKGNRKYFTLGAGLKMTLLSIDFSYLVPSGGRNNPLANTMRFTLNFGFGKPKKQGTTK